jgi:hypothetical protein
VICTLGSFLSGRSPESHFHSEGGTALRFAHRGWTPENAAVRHKFGDLWVLLDAFAALADGMLARSGDRSA